MLPRGPQLGGNVFFTGSGTLPGVTLLAPATLTLTVVPRVAGAVLNVGDAITVTPAAALPNGLNIAYALVTATNVVTIGLSATLTVASGATSTWTVVAHR